MDNPLYGVLGHLTVPLGLGLLRLSTEGRPDLDQAITVIHRALDLGIRVLDTADSYALSDSEPHYGEQLARLAIERWHGPQQEVRVVTKIGMARPKGRWVPNARPEHLRQRVDGSLRALGLERLPLLLLHGNDAGCPFEDQLATLAELQRAGKVEHLGLCNVDVAEIRQAQRHFTVAAIQNELSVINRKAAAEGTLALARDLGIPFLAHRPLGGHAKVDTLEKNRAMKPIAERYRITRPEAALVTLLDAGHPVVPLIGATRIESVESCVRALALRLDAQDRAGLEGKISFEPSADGAALIREQPQPPDLPRLSPGAEPGSRPEVVIVMGVQGAGKSTLVDRYVAAGYERLNRDLQGGSLEDLIPLLTQHLAAGRSRVVLDNTYATRVSRWPVIRAAHAAGVPVRCVHLATPVREALINIVLRILDRYERLLGPEDLKELGKTDPNLPPPLALARYGNAFEAPQADEGYSAIDEIAFERRAGSVLAGTRKALLLDVDGTLRRTRSGEIYPTTPEDIEILPGRRERLQQWVDQGWTLFLVSNQSGIASEKVSAEAVRACFDYTIAQLGVPIADALWCPHPAFPAGCFCRKPMPGLGIALARKHGLALSESVMVGDMDSDAQFAAAIGARFIHAEAFFA
ncbi:MAG: aldo/keto reductase [Lysobacterales bacterium]